MCDHITVTQVPINYLGASAYAATHISTREGWALASARESTHFQCQTRQRPLTMRGSRAAITNLPAPACLVTHLFRPSPDTLQATTTRKGLDWLQMCQRRAQLLSSARQTRTYVHRQMDEWRVLQKHRQSSKKQHIARLYRTDASSRHATRKCTPIKSPPPHTERTFQRRHRVTEHHAPATCLDLRKNILPHTKTLSVHRS